MENKTVNFFSYQLDKKINQSLVYLSNLREVKSIYCFPDISLKEKYVNLGYKIDFPSSVAITTNKNKLSPQLNARGINCGMSMFKVGINPEDDLFVEKITDIILKVNKGLLYNFLYKFHLPLIDKYNISASEMQKISEVGIDYLIEKFKLDKDIRNKFEDLGKCKLSKPLLNNKYLLKKWSQGPKSLIKKFGRNFCGNHFLEAQVIKEIYNKEEAEEYNLSKNDLYIMYHTAGYGLESVANREFCDKYIFQKDVIAIDSDKEREEVTDLYKALMNFSYAYRLMTFIIFKNKIEKRVKGAKVEFITDVPHNTVYEEDDMYIYRRNAIKLHDDKLSIIAGSSNSNSFLVKAGNRASISRYTADHGSGELLKNNHQESKLKIRKILLKHGTNSLITKKISDLKYSNIENPVIRMLEQQKIIKPIASFRPIINLKYN